MVTEGGGYTSVDVAPAYVAARLLWKGLASHEAASTSAAEIVSFMVSIGLQYARWVSVKKGRETSMQASHNHSFR